MTQGFVNNIQALKYSPNIKDTQKVPKTSLLDPHLSVLEMLERAEYSFLGNTEESYTHNGILEILSSSEASEQDQNSGMSFSTYMFSGANHKAELSLTKPSAAKTMFSHMAIYDSDEDGATVTMGMAKNTTSLIMPKLSLSQHSNEKKILLIGEQARRLLLSLFHTYQKMFDCNNFKALSSKEIAQDYYVIMVVFHDISTASSLLDNICSKSAELSVIPICKKGQKHKLSAILRNYTHSKRIHLFCEPISMSNHHEKLRLLKILYQIYNDSDSHTEPFKLSKRSTPLPVCIKDWLVWSFSISIGIGIGCCISLIL